MANARVCCTYAKHIIMSFFALLFFNILRNFILSYSIPFFLTTLSTTQSPLSIFLSNQSPTFFFFLFVFLSIFHSFLIRLDFPLLVFFPLSLLPLLFFSCLQSLFFDNFPRFIFILFLVSLFFLLISLSLSLYLTNSLLPVHSSFRLTPPISSFFSPSHSLL